MIHRGPNDHGIYHDPSQQIYLGQTRLSIQDISTAGHQPMSDDSGRYWIVFNGEIYNFMDIRQELESKGHHFISKTDTEVILYGYREWGEAVVQRLRGMFAFAIYDRGAQFGPGPKGSQNGDASPSLFLARDRFGIKPLYFYLTGDSLIFASEIKALLASGVVPALLDRQTLWDYLSYGSALQPRTFIQGVQALLPGHTAKIALNPLSINFQCYWDIAAATSQTAEHQQPSLTYTEAVTRVRQQLEEATRLHLIADVPVGAFLSGGIDSTAVVGLMSQYVRQPIKTFSIGFEHNHAPLNELRWARLAAARFNTDHHEVIITGQQVAQSWDRLVTAIDQPSHDGTNTFFVSEATKQGGVTVALSGLGGDELFAGYPHFRRISQANRLAPSGLPWAIDPLARLSGFLPGRLRLGLETLTATPQERLASIRRWHKDSAKQQIFSAAFLADFSPEPNTRDQLNTPGNLSPVAAVSYAEIQGYLRDTLLRDADVMSMAHSLELRPVLLDHKLAETVFSLPDSYKLDSGTGKRVFKDAVSDLLPQEIINRPKRGFEFPLNSWLSGVLYQQASYALQSRTAQALFSPDYLMRSRNTLSGSRPPTAELWAVILSLYWFDLYSITA